MKKLLEELKSISYVGIINFNKDRKTLNQAVKLLEAFQKIDEELADTSNHMDEIRGYSGFWGGIVYARETIAKHLKDCGIEG